MAVESAARHSAEEVTFRLQGAMAKIVEEVETLRPLVADVDSTDARSVLGTDAATQRAMRKLLTLAVKYRSVRSTQASAAAVSRPPRKLSEHAYFERPERWRGGQDDQIGKLLHAVSCGPVVRTGPEEAAALREIADRRRVDAPTPRIKSFAWPRATTASNHIPIGRTASGVPRSRSRVGRMAGRLSPRGAGLPLPGSPGQPPGCGASCRDRRPARAGGRDRVRDGSAAVVGAQYTAACR